MNAAHDYRNYPELTEREADVLRLIHEGVRNRKTIGEHLGIKKERVSNILFAACHKMGHPQDEVAAAELAYHIAAI